MFNLKKKTSFLVALACAGAISPAVAQVTMGDASVQGMSSVPGTLTQPLQAEVMAAQPAQGAYGAPATRPASSAARQLGVINEEIAVLSARLNKLKLEADIAAKIREIEEKSGAGEAAARKAAEQTASAKQAEAEVIPPAIHSIEGVDGKLYATLIFSGGMNQIVQKGEVIKDGWKVVGLTSSSVTLTRAGKETRLGFGLPAAASNERGASVGFPGGAPGYGGPVFQ